MLCGLVGLNGNFRIWSGKTICADGIESQCRQAGLDEFHLSLCEAAGIAAGRKAQRRRALKAV